MEPGHQRDQQQQLVDARSRDRRAPEQPPAVRELHALAADARDPAAVARAWRAEQRPVRARVAGARAAPLIEHLPGRHRARGPRVPAGVHAGVHRGARRGPAAQLSRRLPALLLAVPHVPVHTAAPSHRVLRWYVRSLVLRSLTCSCVLLKI